MVQGFDVSKAWESAVVYVPSNFLPKRVIDVKADAPLPVVILLHGCGGMWPHRDERGMRLSVVRQPQQVSIDRHAVPVGKRSVYVQVCLQTFFFKSNCHQPR